MQAVPTPMGPAASSRTSAEPRRAVGPGAPERATPDQQQRLAPRHSPQRPSLRPLMSAPRELDQESTTRPSTPRGSRPRDQGRAPAGSSRRGRSRSGLREGHGRPRAQAGLRNSRHQDHEETRASEPRPSGSRHLSVSKPSGSRHRLAARKPNGPHLQGDKETRPNEPRPSGPRRRGAEGRVWSPDRGTGSHGRAC